MNGMGDIEGVLMSKVFVWMVVGEEMRERDWFEEEEYISYYRVLFE